MRINWCTFPGRKNALPRLLGTVLVRVMKAIRERPIKSDVPLKIFWADEEDLDNKLASVPTHVEVQSSMVSCTNQSLSTPPKRRWKYLALGF